MSGRSELSLNSARFISGLIKTERQTKAKSFMGRVLKLRGALSGPRTRTFCSHLWVAIVT